MLFVDCVDKSSPAFSPPDVRDKWETSMIFRGKIALWKQRVWTHMGEEKERFTPITEHNTP